MKKIVLASASPRRKELLEKIGLKFEVDPSNSVEYISPALMPDEIAKSISSEKALAIAGKYQNAIIIAADTFIVFEGKIMGKPSTEADAKKMLTTLSGRVHSVMTGFTILDTENKKILSKSVETIIYMKELTPQEIDAYVESQEPLDKAGAYAIQGLGAVLVEGIEGDYYNVMGLPLNALVESLNEFGISILSK